MHCVRLKRTSASLDPVARCPSSLAACSMMSGSGFRVQGPGFRVQGSGFSVQGPGSRVQGSGFRVQGSGCRVQGAGFRVGGAGFRVQGSGFRGHRCRANMSQIRQSRPDSSEVDLCRDLSSSGVHFGRWARNLCLSHYHKRGTSLIRNAHRSGRGGGR